MLPIFASVRALVVAPASGGVEDGFGNAVETFTPLPPEDTKLASPPVLPGCAEVDDGVIVAVGGCGKVGKAAGGGACDCCCCCCF